MEERKIREEIKIITPQQQLQEAEIICIIDSIKIIFKYESTNIIEIDRISNFFTGQILIRQMLEPLGYKFLFNGARKDLHPTPMGMQMGMGLTLFPIKDIVSETGRLKNPIPLFGYASLDSISTVVEQEAYYNDIFSSI